MTILAISLALAAQMAPARHHDEVIQQVPVIQQSPPSVIAPPPPPVPSYPQAPPVATLAKLAVPVSNPATWITDDDYPSAALRAGETGVVGFELLVSTTGAVSDCRVTSPSGSAQLDFVTCALLKRRARFKPARDVDGRAVPQSWRSRVRWTIPEAPEVPVASWMSELRFVIAANGELASCSFKDPGAPAISDRSPCVDISEIPVATMRQLRGVSKGPVTIVVRYRHVVTGIGLPAFAALPARFKRIDAWSSTFNVDASGVVGICDGTIDDHDLPVPAVTCRSWTQYLSGGDPFSVTATIIFYTDGDAKVAAVLPKLGTPGD
jgi:TonB family protein